tara:strand:+ start:431 stop:937 length:507 start_codon:yes stop_codon:yes gene_type:complete
MKYKFLFIFSIFFCSELVKANISVEHLNNELKKDYSFIERSLNQSDLKIESSKGKIINDKSAISVLVKSPFEENYRIEGSTMEIYDVYLDQKHIVDFKTSDNFFLNILMNGIEENSEEYRVSINANSIDIISRDEEKTVNFLFNNNSLRLIKYRDSIGVEHGIELTEL